MEVSIFEIGADLRELSSVEEAITAGEQIGGGDEILNSSDDWLPISWCNEVVLHTHELKGFCAGFFCLRDI